MTDLKKTKKSTDPEKRKSLIYCSLCRKNQDDVDLIIVGPGSHICDECVDICAEIVKEHRNSKDKS